MTQTYYVDPGWMKSEAGVCAKHGEWSYARPRKSVSDPECPTCRSDRLEAEEAAARIAAEEQRKREDIEQRVANVQAPPRFRDAAFEGFGDAGVGQRRTAEIARKFAAGVSAKTHAGRWLVLIGPPGVGKTHLGIAAGLEVARSLASAIYVRLPELLLEVRASYAKRTEESEGEILEFIQGHRLIVIDEIMELTEHGRRLLFELIDDRYRRGLPLVLISNSTRAEFEAIVGERAADRIAEQATFLACEWPSFRRRPAVSR